DLSLSRAEIGHLVFVARARLHYLAHAHWRLVPRLSCASSRHETARVLAPRDRTNPPASDLLVRHPDRARFLEVFLSREHEQLLHVFPHPEIRTLRPRLAVASLHLPRRDCRRHLSRRPSRRPHRPQSCHLGIDLGRRALRPRAAL